MRRPARGPGAWRRVGGKLTVAPWEPPASAVRKAVASEVEALGRAIGRPLRPRWLE